MELVRIVIPVYKRLSDLELISIKQCFSVLISYPLTVVSPPGLDLLQIQEVSESIGKEVPVEVFPAEFFAGIEGYNKLMLSVDFYARFKNSAYLLIYQTDAFVFRDDLTYWCRLGYDYVAAPWPFDVSRWIDVYPKEIKTYCKIFGRKNVSKIGNGGLSLRRTQSFINNLKFFKGAVSRWNLNEDMFYSHYVNTLNPFFRIPGVELSMQFAFDVDPAGYYKLNNYELPFGCHGWNRDDEDYKENMRFYKPFVEAYGHKLDG